MIGFLLVLTTGSLNLVMQEMQDGRGRQNQIKAHAAAEGAMELALLQIKEQGYGFWDDVQDSDILWDTKKDAKISYTYDGRVQSYSGSLDPGGVDIIPLFWIENTGTQHPIDDITFDITSSSTLYWNIITENGGVSGSGSFDEGDTKDVKTLSWDAFSLTPKTISQILRIWDTNYLMVVNPWEDTESYLLKTTPWNYNFFTTPRETIESSATVWKYTQNIDTSLDNTEFLWILQYSIYSQ